MHMDAYTTPTNDTDYNCHRTYLTNHMGSISHHITPLVINSLGGGHTHKHAYRRLQTKQFLETRHTPAAGQRVPGLKTQNLLYTNTGGYSLIQ